MMDVYELPDGSVIDLQKVIRVGDLFINKSNSSANCYEVYVENGLSYSVLDIELSRSTFLEVYLNSKDKSSVVTKDFYAEVAVGNIDGHSLVTVQGENLDVDVGNPENLWCAGGLMVYPEQGEQWEVSSSSTEDTNSLGEGAQGVLIRYLDSNYTEQQEIVSLNGKQPVLTQSSDCFRLLGVTVVSAGSSAQNLGVIKVKDVVSGLIRGYVAIDYNRSAHGFYTVPLGYTAFFLYGHAAMGKGKDAKIDLYIASSDTGIFTRSSFADLYQNSITFQPTAPVGTFTEKTELQWRCTTLNGNADATAFMQLLLVENRVLNS